MGGILPSMVSLRSAGKAGPSKFDDPDAGHASPSLCCCSRSCSDGASCVSSSTSDNASCVPSSSFESVPCVSLVLVQRQLLFLSQLLNIELQSPSLDNGSISRRLHAAVVTAGAVTPGLFGPECTACLYTIFLVLTLARSSVFFGTACRFALAWKHVSHPPHWPVVSIPTISAVFLVTPSLGCASMR